MLMTVKQVVLHFVMILAYGFDVVEARESHVALDEWTIF